jgi:hypothetical protein
VYWRISPQTILYCNSPPRISRFEHNKIKSTQSWSTFGGMPVDDFNKDFVIAIETQTDVRQNGVYEYNTTDDFHGTYREFHRLPYAEYDGFHRDPTAYQSTWCGINVLTDSGEYWWGQSLHSRDFTLDEKGECTMNVHWQRGSNASWVLNPDNHKDMFNDLVLRHIFEALDGELEYTEDKNKIIVKGSYIGHSGPELAFY